MMRIVGICFGVVWLAAVLYLIWDSVHHRVRVVDMFIPSQPFPVKWVEDEQADDVPGWVNEPNDRTQQQGRGE